MLEGDKDLEAYRWVAIEPKRLCTGHVNPETLEDAYRQHEVVLELAPHLLTISHLDCEALDVMFGFDFTYEGNHDEIVAEALGVGPALEGLFEMPGARVINFEPSLTLVLDESCKLQARLSLETRTNAYQVRTGEFPDDQISVFFTVRQYWGPRPGDVVPRLVPPPARDRRGRDPADRHPPDRPPARPGDRLALSSPPAPESPLMPRLSALASHLHAEIGLHRAGRRAGAEGAGQGRRRAGDRRQPVPDDPARQSRGPARRSRRTRRTTARASACPSSAPPPRSS